MFARTLSGTVSGFDGHIVHVEVDISRGLPMFDIVGLPDASTRESRDRVRAALRNAGFHFPVGRIIVNLAPADIPKSGPACDLAIAMGILAASGQLPAGRLHQYCFIGELSLDGVIHGVPGLLPIVLRAARERLPVLISSAATGEASLVPGLPVVTADTLRDAVEWMRRHGKAPRPGEILCASVKENAPPAERSPSVELFGASSPPGASEPGTVQRAEDLSDVKGQRLAKRALEIAAAGDHNVLMVGPPGVGKTMLARRLAGILPLLTQDEHLEVCRIYSIGGLLDARLVSTRRRPFRAPHHSATRGGLLGGARGLPGEVSLAHHGVLFLDELNEFPRGLLESLRQPLEDGAVVLARLPRPVRFPAKFTLVAAANPCPCGYYGDVRRECTCRQHAVEAYRGKLSGPLADRIDLYVEMSAPTWQELADGPSSDTSDRVRERVSAARLLQQHRFSHYIGASNGRMGQQDLRRHCHLDAATESLLRFAAHSLRLSARGVHRTLRVARTIADLAGAERIQVVHVQEALAFRSSLGEASKSQPSHIHHPNKGGGS